MKNRTLYSRQKLVVSKAFRPPPPGPPQNFEVIQALKILPSERTKKDHQVIFRYLLFNKQINYMFQTPEQIEEISKQATYVSLIRSKVLFFEGDDPDGWYLVLSGSVDVIIRYFLVAHDCTFDSDINETIQYANLMDIMEIDPNVDKLKKVKTLREGDTFGQHGYYLEKNRSSTILGVSPETILMKFPDTTLYNTQALLQIKNTLSVNKSLLHSALPSLRDEQLFLINGFSQEIRIPIGTKISARSSLGHNLYILKKGTMKRMRIVDFTSHSFRKISATFESLQPHFPDGLYPVHVNNIQLGELFADPEVSEFADHPYQIHAITDCVLVAYDFEYFTIISGRVEVERVGNNLKSPLSDENVIKIWIDLEKERLWNKFKTKELKGAHKELKTEKRARTATVAIRRPTTPKSIKEYRPKKVVPYAPPSLR